MKEGIKLPVIFGITYSISVMSNFEELISAATKEYEVLKLSELFQKLSELDGGLSDEGQSRILEARPFGDKLLSYSRDKEKHVGIIPEMIETEATNFLKHGNELLLISKGRKLTHGDRALFDLLYYIGAGRSILFKGFLSERVFDILMESSKFELQDGARYLIFPWINVVKTSGRESFIKDICFSLIMIPVDEDFSSRREISPEEIYFFFSSERRAKLILENNVIRENTTTGFFKEYIKDFLSKMKIVVKDDEFRHIEDYSRGVVFAIDRSLNYQLISSYFTGGSDADKRKFESSLYNFLYQEAYLINKRIPRTVDFQKLLIMPEYRIDTDHVSYYDPNDNTIVEILPAERENLNSWSILWGFIWDTYECMGLSRLSLMIDNAFKMIDETRESFRLIQGKVDLMKNIDEYYDLALKFPLYKLEYSKLKIISRIENDYRTLKEKLDSVKEDTLALSEQKLSVVNTMISYLLLIYMILSILIAILVAKLHYEITVTAMFAIAIIAITLVAYYARRLRRFREGS